LCHFFLTGGQTHYSGKSNINNKWFEMVHHFFTI
jgi:hypothetical protein